MILQPGNNMNRFGMMTLALASAAAVVVAPAAASAQVSLEVRGGLQKPTGDFGDGVGGDAGFGGDVFFSVSPRLSIYGGYGIEKFDSDVESSGFEAGAKFIFASPGSGVLPWVRGGAILHKLENGGLIQVESDRSLGIQAAAGVDIPLGNVLSFSPAVRYQTYTPDFDGLDDGSVSFVSLDFGVHIHPGG